MRFALNQNRSMSERFVSYLEQALERQERLNDRFQQALNELGENVRENSALLNRVVERLGIA